MLKQAARSCARAILPSSVRRSLVQWRDYRTLPERARLEDRRDRRGEIASDPGIDQCIEASSSWLVRAQDRSASADGGVSRHFSLVTGWAESYPETTGYIIPTMLECSRALDRPDLRVRAQRMLDWCLDIQLPDGSYQAGTIAVEPKTPSTFNTGQILLGLAAGAKAFGKAKYVDAMHRAATWLRDTQDPDGCWRRFPSPFAAPGEKTYETHVSWGLFETERVAPGNDYAKAGLKQVEWALTRQLPNGWFRDCCLTEPDRPLTHTLGYALRGILEAYRISGDKRYLEAAALGARALLSRLSPDGYLPGRFDAAWNGAANWACLTGSMQLALCWSLLFQATGDAAFENGVTKANEYVRRRVRTTGEPDIVGGVKGSFPVSGDYGPYQYLNWAAKFFLDSNLEEKKLSAPA